MAASINHRIFSNSNNYQSCPNYFQAMRSSNSNSSAHASTSNNQSSIAHFISNQNMQSNERTSSTVDSNNVVRRSCDVRSGNINNNNRVLPSSASSSYDVSSPNSPSISISSSHPYHNQSNYLLPISSCRPGHVKHSSQDHSEDESDDDGEVFTSADQEVRRVMSATIARTARHTANKNSSSVSIDHPNCYSSGGSVREALC